MYYICKRIPEGTYVSSAFFRNMIDKNALQQFVEARLEGTDYFLVGLTVSKDNEIKVEIDSRCGVDIDFCIELTRAIEEAFSRDEEDYELEVGSAGLTTPFKVQAQYEKNIGNKVEVLTKDGKKLHGILADADADGFKLMVTEKVKPEGAKRPVEQTREIAYAYGDVKSVRYELEF